MPIRVILEGEVDESWFDGIEPEDLDEMEVIRGVMEHIRDFAEDATWHTEPVSVIRKIVIDENVCS